MKENDPISWECALSAYKSNKEVEGLVVSLDGGSTYFFCEDIETTLLIDEQ